MVYKVCYNCPHCKNPDCGEDKMWIANELVEARSKAEARQIFNNGKPCRHMKIVEIVEDEEMNRKKEERTAIIREIWMIQQDNLRRSDILDRASDPGFRATIMENMRAAEERIEELKSKLI